MPLYSCPDSMLTLGRRLFSSSFITFIINYPPSLSQMSRAKLMCMLPWREKVGRKTN